MIAIDVETSGLYARHEILSVGVYSPEYAFYLRMRTDKPVDSKAIEINGLDPSEGLSQTEGRRLFMQSFSKKEIVLGHNYAFDLGFLKQWLPDYGKVFHYHYRDSMGAALFLRDKGLYHGSVSLQVLCEHFGITHYAHTALGDAMACWHVYQRLLQM